MNPVLSSTGNTGMPLPEKMKALYLEKAECAIGLPEWLLPQKMVDTLRQKVSQVAIVEIAGRDSIAAAVRAVEEGPFTDLLPTYAFTGTEHGSLEKVVDAVRRLRERLSGTLVHDLVILGSSSFWQTLNGRFISELISRFGCYSPCIGCHLYLHAVRIPLAARLGGAAVVAGERESHDGKVKINQMSEALERYQALCREFNIPLLFPLRYVSTSAEVERIIGGPWKEGREQLGCVLSGNYRLLDGKAGITGDQVGAYLDEFGIPCARDIIATYLKGKVPDFVEIARMFLRK